MFDPLACIYHPIRTAALSHAAEFAEASERLHGIRQRIAHPAGDLLDVTDVLPGDLLAGAERIARCSNPPWDADFMRVIMSSVHREWSAAGQIIWDMSAALQDGTLRPGKTTEASCPHQVLEAGCPYVHFGAAGPASPWDDCRIEGCYLNAASATDGTACTFVLSQPPGQCPGSTPAALYMAGHLRCHDGVFLRHGTPLSISLDDLRQVSDRHLHPWSACIAGAVTILAASLAVVSEAVPDTIRYGYPQGTPVHMAELALSGCSLAALEAAGDLASVGLRPVYCYLGALSPRAA